MTNIISFKDTVHVKRAKARCVKLELDTPVRRFANLQIGSEKWFANLQIGSVVWYANLQIGSDSEAGTKSETSTVYEDW